MPIKEILGWHLAQLGRAIAAGEWAQAKRRLMLMNAIVRLAALHG